MHELLEKINQVLEKLEKAWDWLVNKINDLLDWVPWGLGWVVDKFKKLWNIAVEKMGEFWDLIQPIVTLPGVPWDLNGKKDDWTTMGGTASDEVQTATEEALHTDDANRWKGTAHDAYVKGLSNQKSALKGIKSTFVDKIVPALDSVASAIYVFWGCVVGAVAILIIAVNVATGEAVSIVGLPALPPTVWTAIGACIVAISAGLLNLRSACANSATAFSLLATENTDYGDNNWPQMGI